MENSEEEVVTWLDSVGEIKSRFLHIKANQIYAVVRVEALAEGGQEEPRLVVE